MKHFILFTFIFLFSLFHISCDDTEQSLSDKDLTPTVQASTAVPSEPQEVQAPDHVPAPKPAKSLNVFVENQEESSPVEPTPEAEEPEAQPIAQSEEAPTVEGPAAPTSKVLCVKEGAIDITFYVYNYEPGSEERLCEIFDSRSQSPRWYATQDKTFCDWLVGNCLVEYDRAKCNDPSSDFRVPSLPGYTCVNSMDTATMLP